MTQNCMCVTRNQAITVKLLCFTQNQFKKRFRTLFVCLLSVCVCYPFGAQHVDDLVEHWGPEEVAMNQQGLHGVTCGWVITLGVSD